MPPKYHVFVDTVIMLDWQSPGCLMGTYGIHAMLFHCDFYTLFTNSGYYDRAGLRGEGCCAVDGGGGAEGLAIDAIEADCLVVVETGDVDETTG